MDTLVQPMLGDGVYFLSMKDILQKTDFVTLYSDGTHLHPPGQALIADAVLKKLLAEKIISPDK
jgi:lysophospholipase L1-like esterase